MSTPEPLYHMFELGAMTVTHTTLENDTAVLHVAYPREELRCSGCGSAEVTLGGAVVRRLRHLPIGRRPTILQLTVRRLACERCGVVRQQHLPCAPAHKRYTHAFARYVWDLSRIATVADVAKLLGVSWGLVRQIQEHFLRQSLGQIDLATLRRLAIDELALGKGHDYVTVVLDLDSGAAVHVGEGKGVDAVTVFLQQLREAGAQLEAVACDMGPAYHLAVRLAFPEVRIVLDHFHVVKLMNDKLSELRRSLYQTERHVLRKHVLKGTRWLLLKLPAHLDPAKREPERLAEALQLNQPLAIGYYLKEDLAQFWHQDDLAQATRFLDDWLARAEATRLWPLRTLATTLRRHRQELLNYYHVRLSTGPLEGFNNKAQTMKRQAYGYRNREFYKLKLLTLHLTRYALVG